VLFLTPWRRELRAKVATVPGARPAYRWAVDRWERSVHFEWARERWERSFNFKTVTPEAAVRLTYQVLLDRDPDPIGRETWVPALRRGELTRRELVQMVRCSPEFESAQSFSGGMLGPSIHIGRCRFIKSLPRASRIVDLGGTSLGDERGALVALGYPYRFESLVIVDLPSDERHALYQSAENPEVVETDKGPVSYRYHSMVDLSAFEDVSVDLVYSGQSIEHVQPDEAVVVLKEVQRILRPGARLALDTPNGRVTRLKQPEFIDPDHKAEYTWPDLRQMLTDAGFEIEWAKGLNYAGESLASGRFNVEEVTGNCGFFDAIEDCYILAVVAVKPE
jgi:predicted SAM-dependent methyltransferase